MTLGRSWPHTGRLRGENARFRKFATRQGRRIMTRRITPLRIVIGTGALAALGAGALPLLAQGGSAPTARYEMRAETMSGMGAMGQGGGMGSALSMAFGGGGSQVSKVLELEIGSSLAAADG